MKFRQNPVGAIVSSLPLNELIPQLESSFNRLGKLTNSEADFLSGWIRYGFQKVKVRISWIRQGEDFCIIIQSQSDDIWNYGGKNARDRFTNLLLNHNNPGFEVDRLGLPRSTLFGIGLGFLSLMILLYFVVENILP